jgi:hypothetical protein
MTTSDLCFDLDIDYSTREIAVCGEFDIATAAYFKTAVSQLQCAPRRGRAQWSDTAGLSATTTSVVRNSAAMDAAFCRAERVTLAGSTMPSSNMSTY